MRVHPVPMSSTSNRSPLCDLESRSPDVPQPSLAACRRHRSCSRLAARAAAQPATAPNPATRGSGSAPAGWTPPRRSGTSASSRARRRRRSSSRATPGDFEFINSDLSFWGNYVIQGNFSAIRCGTFPQPSHPTLHTAYVCPGSQSDVSVYRNLMFVSGEALNGRTRLRHAGRARHGEPGPAARHSHLRHHRHRAPEVPDERADVPRLAHAHGGDRSARHRERVHLHLGHGAGAVPARAPGVLELRRSEEDPNTALFRIEVIRVPLAAPQQARIVSSPRIFGGLTEPADARRDARRTSPPRRRSPPRRAPGRVHRDDATAWSTSRRAEFVNPLLDSIVSGSRQGPARRPRPTAPRCGRPSRASWTGWCTAPPVRAARVPGPTQCHDITVYPGDRARRRRVRGLRPAARHPRRGATRGASPPWPTRTSPSGTRPRSTTTAPRSCSPTSGAAGWQPRCRATDKPEWGANAIFTLAHDTMTFQSYYKLPAPQTPYRELRRAQRVADPDPGPRHHGAGLVSGRHLGVRLDRSGAPDARSPSSIAARWTRPSWWAPGRGRRTGTTATSSARRSRAGSTSSSCSRARCSRRTRSTPRSWCTSTF